METNSRTMAPTLENALERLGFAAGRKGEEYRLNGFLFSRDGHWGVFKNTHALPSEDLLGGLGKPGLWKTVSTAAGHIHQEFAFPIESLARDGSSTFEEEEAFTPPEALLNWAMATSQGAAPEQWRPPLKEEIESWLPPQGMTVQAGPLVRQGTLHHCSNRVALSFPILNRVPCDLPESRKLWLRAVLLDTQNRWRLVRIGMETSLDGAAVLAEVDLTGAPEAVIESLFLTSLAALRWVVQWLVPTAALLADSKVSCRALEVSFPRDYPAERRIVS